MADQQTDIIEACDLLIHQTEILRLIHHVATDPPGKPNPKADLANFLFCNALHIREMGKAALTLMGNQNPYAVVLLGRAALESAFSIVAAVKDKGFGPQRLAFEMEDLAKKLELMIEKGDWPTSRRPTPDECRKAADRIRREYSAPALSHRRDIDRITKIEQIAKTAGLSPYYDDDYRQLSLTVHGNQAGVLNAGSGFLVRKGMLAICTSTFLACEVLTTAFKIKSFDAELKDHHSRLDALMQKADFLPKANDRNSAMTSSITGSV
jgi:hypothetical protein